LTDTGRENRGIIRLFDGGAKVQKEEARNLRKDELLTLGIEGGGRNGLGESGGVGERGLVGSTLWTPKQTQPTNQPQNPSTDALQREGLIGVDKKERDGHSGRDSVEGPRPPVGTELRGTRRF